MKVDRIVEVNTVRHRGTLPEGPLDVSSTPDIVYVHHPCEEAEEVESLLKAENFLDPFGMPDRGKYIPNSADGPVLIFDTTEDRFQELLDRVTLAFACRKEAATWYGYPRVRVGALESGDIKARVLELRRTLLNHDN